MSVGKEILRKHPRRWTPEDQADALSFLAYEAYLAAEREKQSPKK